MHIHVINLKRSQGGEKKICMHERIVIVAATLRNCCTLHKRQEKKCRSHVQSGLLQTGCHFASDLLIYHNLGQFPGVATLQVIFKVIHKYFLLSLSGFSQF